MNTSSGRWLQSTFANITKEDLRSYAHIATNKLALSPTSHVLDTAPDAVAGSATQTVTRK
jgi:hypothetical protein